ncbi:MAG: hypothetical protein SOY42_09785 [Clostridium sp.]|nr:hypothetical protein [Clostridium sp.]
MAMANEMFSLAMKRQRDLINEDLIALIEESSMNGKTNCRVDYISDDDKKRLEHEGFKITENQEIKEVYEHTLPVLNKIPTKKPFPYYVIDWSEASNPEEEEKKEEENKEEEKKEEENKEEEKKKSVGDLAKEFIENLSKILNLLEKDNVNKILNLLEKVNQQESKEEAKESVQEEPQQEVQEESKQEEENQEE